MTPTEYRAARQRIGTQVAVARALGVARSTVLRREDGSMPITTEAAMAIRALKLVTRHSSLVTPPIADSR